MTTIRASNVEQRPRTDVQVSVIMAVYNGERFVSEAIRSVLAQSHVDLELIIIDDGSTDDTVAIVGEFDDSRIRLVRQQQGGVAPARNRGIDEATGEFVAFIDHDDVWFSDKLAEQMPLFADPDVGVVGSYMTYLGDDGPTRAVSGEATRDQQQRIAAGKLMPFALSSVVVRADLVRRLGRFDAGLARVAQVEDLDLVARCAQQSTIETVTRPLGHYRVHSNAASFQTFNKMRAGARFVRARIEARQAGADLEWEQWSDTSGRRARRGDRANFLYRSGAFQLVSGRRLQGTINLLWATVLAPTYVLPRLQRQLTSGRSVRTQL